MIFFKFLFLIMIIVQSTCLTNNDLFLNKFKNWTQEYDIKINSNKHYLQILNNWIENEKYIQLINSKNLTYVLAHNRFSGMNSNEFSLFMNFNEDFIKQNLLFKHNYKKKLKLFNDVNIFNSIDWRQRNAVTPIKNQGQCGSCWAFSGISTLESAIAIKTGKLYNISEQQSVDCSISDYGFSNMGCNGGWYDELWEYAHFNNGVCSDDTYPYTSGKTKKIGICHNNCTIIEGSKVIDYINVKRGSDIALTTALNLQPVSIAIQASTKSFQLYQSGIYTDFEGCGTDIDHAVVLVGYDNNDKNEYYILRNSWGAEWGEEGYMRIAKSKKYEPSGMCGLLEYPMYPLV